MITQTIDLSRLLAKFSDMRDIPMAPALRQVALMVERFVKRRFDTSTDVSGARFAPLYPKPENAGRKPLKNTGALQASIRGTSSATEARIGTPLLHSRILNYGGKTQPHAIAPRRARMLSWTTPAGDTVYRPIVQHPGSNIPERKFMGLSPLEELRVRTVFSEQIARTIRRGSVA